MSNVSKENNMGETNKRNICTRYKALTILRLLFRGYPGPISIPPLPAGIDLLPSPEEGLVYHLFDTVATSQCVRGE